MTARPSSLPGRLGLALSPWSALRTAGAGRGPQGLPCGHEADSGQAPRPCAAEAAKSQEAGDVCGGRPGSYGKNHRLAGIFKPPACRKGLDSGTLGHNGTDRRRLGKFVPDAVMIFPGTSQKGKHAPRTAFIPPRKKIN